MSDRVLVDGGDGDGGGGGGDGDRGDRDGDGGGDGGDGDIDDGLDRVLVDGGDRPSRNFPRFHSKQLAILKKDENYQILFGNTLIFPSPVDLLAWSDPIYKKKTEHPYQYIHINITARQRDRFKL